MKYTFSFIFLYFLLNLIAQDNFNSRKVFLEAEIHVLYYNYQLALPLYEKLLEKDSLNKNLNYLAGICCLNIPNQTNKASFYLKRALIGNLTVIDTTITTNINEKARWIIGSMQNKALARNNVFDTISTNKKQYGIDLQNINSESNLIISGDGNTFIYMLNNGTSTSISFVQKTNSIWSQPKEITQELSRRGNLFCSSLSNDGKRLYLTSYDNFESEVYCSNYNGIEWETAKKVNEISTSYWESHASETPDGKTLYFASNRPGGYGGMDIYYSELLENNKWSEPINLGSTINTKLNDDAPSMLNKGRTLFFSSQGHGSKGNYDIFYTSKIDTFNWSKPENVKYPINTEDDDMFYTPLSRETMFYFAENDAIMNTSNDLTIQKISNLNISIERADSLNILNNQIQAFVIDKITQDTINVTLNNEGKFVMPLTKEGVFSLVILNNGVVSNERPIIVPYIVEGEDIYITEVLSDSSIEPNNKQMANSQISKALDKLNIKRYTIQVTANLRDIDFKKLPKREMIRVSRGEDGFSRCTISEFDFFSEAKKLLNEIQAQGFTDAFIRETSSIQNYNPLINK